MMSILICLLVLSNILVDVKPSEITYMSSDCSSSTSNYIEGSKFQSNLNSLLYRLMYNNGGNSIYAKASEGDDPDKVHGVFLCRGDIEPKDCENCIREGSEQMLRECPLKKQAIIWYDECLVRYSNVPFGSRFNRSSLYWIACNPQSVSWEELVKGISGAMFDNLTPQATNLKYAENSEEFTPSQKLYSMLQCIPDLSAADCRTCLEGARSVIPKSVPRECRVVHESCTLRYQFRKPGGRGNKDQGGSTSKTKRTSIIIGVVALLVVVLAGSSIYLVKTRRRTEKEGNGKSQQIQLLSMDGVTLDDNDDFGL